MVNLTDWIKEELYPSLFENINSVFPEHNFTRYSGGWKSNTYLNGDVHRERKDKTKITKKAPGYIMEQGGDVLSLVDYVRMRDKVEFIQAVKTLASAAGLQVPQSQVDQEAYQRNKDVYSLREFCNSYFIYCLEKAPGAEEARKYLLSRGYTLEDAKAMELGYIPPQENVFSYLTNKKGYSAELVEEALKIKKDARIGSTHQITIPYRSGGTIKGFKFRTANTATPKYLNSLDLDKIGGFFNLSALKGDKDLTIMEGELDCLHATIKGMLNIVATGGSSVSSEQVKDALRKGAKSFTICFDTEEAGTKKAEEAEDKVNRAIDVIIAERVNRIYIVNLPDIGEGKTDPDSLIKAQGIESLKTAKAKALPYYEYWLQTLLHKYGKIEEQQPEGLTPRDVNNLLDEIVETAAKIPDAIDRDRYKKAFIDLKEIQDLGITEESLSITVDRLTTTRDKEAQAKDVKKLLFDATALYEKGEVGKVIDLLGDKHKDIKLKDKSTEFNGLLIPIHEHELKERLANKTESIKSGYTIDQQEILIPTGAITIVAAPTSHGKTTFMINSALNIVEEYPDKEVHFFSYEEDKDAILINSLNTYIGEDISGNNRRSLKSYFSGNPQFIRSEKLNLFEAKKAKFFNDLVHSRRLNIHYTNYNSDTLIDAIRFLYKNTNIGAVFIDYIQLLNLPKGKYKTYSRQEELKEICLALKDISVETGLAIILGAQFNRDVINHLMLLPTKIREAGDIEQIANLIMAFWDNRFKPSASGKEMKEIAAIHETGTIYTKILRYRGGEPGGCELLPYNSNAGKIFSNK